MKIKSNNTTNVLKQNKTNRILIGFLEIMTGRFLDLSSNTLDLTKQLDESIEVILDETFEREVLIWNTHKSIAEKIINHELLHNLYKKYKVVAYEVDTYEFNQNYLEFDIQTILNILSAYDIGIDKLLNDVTISKEEKIKIKKSKEEFYKVCNFYFEKDGGVLEKFKHPQIIQFIKKVGGL